MNNFYNYQYNPFQSNTQRNWKYYLQNFIQNKSAINKLILINIAVFLVEWIVEIILNLSGFLFSLPNLKENGVEWIIHYFGCPASFETLLFRPWALITSLFLHIDFFHILFNMLMLSVMGKIFCSYLSEKHLWITYIVGGIFGNLFYMVSYNLFPAFQGVISASYAIGASGAIMAIMAAITAQQPNHTLSLLFIGNVKLKWLTCFFIIIDIINIDNGNPGGHLAHLGGVIYGFLSMIFLKKGTQFKFRKRKRERKQKYATASNFEYNKRPESDEQYNARKVEEKAKIDAILDKISKNGYDSLTKEEKDFLFFSSKK